ncbi:MAG: RidA family protein [Acidobacteria bacterium]|nr:RidA family protein [Acidobacteriota bacterium]
MSNPFEMINPPEAGPHSGFSHGVKVQAGQLLFIAGQVGWDENARIVSPDFVAQFDRALANVLSVVRHAGGQPQNVVRITLYVLNCQDYLANVKELGQVYRRHMGKHYPAMTLVEVKGLVEAGARLELEATAAL